MGNKTSHYAIEGTTTSRTKSHTTVEKATSRKLLNRQNHVACDILEQHVSDHTPTDDEMKIALAMQQTQVKGNLKKTDLIAILIRLNPERDNALMSQFTVEDLNGLIRHELYTVPLQTVASQQATSQPNNLAEIEDIN